MDWYFDIVALLGTFFVIALGMTIYARLHPTRPRVRRSHYIYTGIIPTITISSADSPTKRSPTTLTPADSVEDEEHKTNSSATPVDDVELTKQLKNSQNNHLTIPVSDDEDEEEQQNSSQSEFSNSISDNVVENKNKAETVRLEKSIDKDLSQNNSLNEKKNKNVIQDPEPDNENSSKDIHLIEDLKENKQQFDKSIEEDHSESASLSGIDNIEDDLSECLDLSDLIDDLRASPIPNSTHSTNKSLCKIGTSHTVEEPLFPFSEILEEDNPSIRKNLKKRLSQ